MEAAAGVRASDAERERTVRELRRHLDDGRLSVDEFAERIERAYTARTLGELDALTTDLPPVVRATPTRAVRPPTAWPGNSPFTVRVESPRTPAEVVHEAMRTVAPLLSACGYELRQADGRTLVFTRSRRPVWTILAALFLFPFGLLALLHRKWSRVVISASELGRGRTAVDVFGVAPARVRRAIGQLAR